MAGLLGEVVYRDGPLCERSAPEQRLLNFGRGRRRFQASFRRVTASATGVRIIKTPVQAPRANAIAERWITSGRRECLDRMLITGERHLRLVLGEYADHYNGHRPLHRNPPAGRQDPPAAGTSIRVLRRDRLAGLIHEYAQVRSRPACR